MFRIIHSLLLLLLLAACQQPASNNNTFQHGISGDNKPWSHTQFDNQNDKFSFAVFSDLTGGERAGVFKVAIEQLNLLRPELIINVGDLIEGADSDTSEWHRQWDSFDKRASKARAPFFYMGGNHDLTGQLSRYIWKERLGPRYYHFRYKDVLFLILDTEDHSIDRMAEIELMRSKAIEQLKEGGWEAFGKSDYANIPERTSGTISREQAEYFLNVIDTHQDVLWTFVLIHKPAWEKPEEMQFSRIEKALNKRPYTVFNGHTHVYKYMQRHGRDYINLATTGGHQFPETGPSYDHMMWVTVDKQGVSMANLKLSGIMDKTGQIPLNGDTLAFE
ncbi:metallophosphoesterase family protein [Carboxylicivirga marina]|uniref:Metallophosphoesterase n=1 Tax=Carboxylicivirga marina TaxID=2800988 RepID=A0ABS1HGF5_9BACT|nr:metallophosphoesterase family protein [Carboxylicivirga marina]MBK3516738.1 metallophosphoesterase [Carboxylicivirga marina]